MTGQELNWAAPEVAWWFFAVLGLVLLILLHFQWKAWVSRRLGDRPLIKRMTSGVSRFAQVVRWVMVTLAITLLITALVRPKYGTREAALENRGIDVVIALDMSKSMKVGDVLPDRLQASIVELEEVLNELHGGRVALVPFAGTAFTQTALTTDFDSVREYLASLRIEDMPLGGTRIGTALEHSLALFEKADQRAAEAQKKAERKRERKRDKGEDEEPEVEIEQPVGSHFKAIILVTDGDDQDNNALEVAQKAYKKNVRIFTIGVGAAGSTSPIPIITDDGKHRGYQQDKDGKLLFSDLNMDLLHAIANATDGKAFQYHEKGVATQLASELDKLEKKEYEHSVEALKEDRFQLVLIPALLLLLGEMWISDRRRRRRKTA